MGHHPQPAEMLPRPTTLSSRAGHRPGTCPERRLTPSPVAPTAPAAERIIKALPAEPMTITEVEGRARAPPALRAARLQHPADEQPAPWQSPAQSGKRRAAGRAYPDPPAETLRRGERHSDISRWIQTSDGLSTLIGYATASDRPDGGKSGAEEVAAQPGEHVSG